MDAFIVVLSFILNPRARRREDAEAAVPIEIIAEDPIVVESKGDVDFTPNSSKRPSLEDNKHPEIAMVNLDITETPIISSRSSIVEKSPV